MDDKTFEEELIEDMSSPVSDLSEGYWGCIFILREPIEEEYRHIDFSKINRDKGKLVVPDDLSNKEKEK